MSYFFFFVWSVGLASYFYWVGSRNGRDEGIEQAGKLWPIDMRSDAPIDNRNRR